MGNLVKEGINPTKRGHHGVELLDQGSRGRIMLVNSVAPLSSSFKKNKSSWVSQSHKNMQLTKKSYMQYNLNGKIFLKKL